MIMSVRCSRYTSLRSLRRDLHAGPRAPYSEPTLLHARTCPTPPLLPSSLQHRSVSSAMSTASSGGQKKPSSLQQMEQETTLSPPSLPTQSTQPNPTCDPTKPFITIPLDSQGSILKRNIVISPAVKNPTSLTTALLELLSPSPSPSPLVAQWSLDPAGHAITRSYVLNNTEQARLFRERISAVSDEMNHHARVSLESAASAAEEDTAASSTQATAMATTVTVTCTTHQPPGLSMRDVRLARRIDELSLELG
jgi:pterin-4a-carbinolamine dehydratase